MERADAQIPTTKNIEGQTKKQTPPGWRLKFFNGELRHTRLYGVFTHILENCVGGDSLAWNILIPKLDFKSQMKIAKQNQRLEDVVNENADSQLRKFKRHIREDRYM